MMAKVDKVYREFQAHLDRQPVGFPKTISGVEIKVLKYIFTKEQARIAIYLDYRFQSLETIHGKPAFSGYTKDELKEILDQAAKKGGIGYRSSDGQYFYCNMPLVVGMYEGFLKNLTPDFIKDFGKYTATPSFGISFLSTAVPQMRTIPVSESITPEHNVSSFDQVSDLIGKSTGPFAVIECICRKKKAMEGEKCRVTDRTETCLTANETAAVVLHHGMGREISRLDAIDLLAENTKQGLVLQPSNTREIEFVCSCCGCCCGMLNVQKQLPRPLDFWAANYFAVLDMDKCTLCGVCAKKCQVDAITVKRKNRKIEQIKLNTKKCIGCGNCVAACKFDAISLIKKDVEAIPPKTYEELNDTLMKNKKGKWGKIKMVSKLILGIPQ